MNFTNKKLLPLLIFLVVILLSCTTGKNLATEKKDLPQNTNSQDAGSLDTGSKLQLRTAFGSTNILKVKTQGIFAIWWDPKFDHEADLPQLFSWLEMCRPVKGLSMLTAG